MRTILALLATARGTDHRAVFQSFAARLARVIARGRGEAVARVRVVEE
jgi:hypothetical protein